MGHVMKNGLDLLATGRTTRLDIALNEAVNYVDSLTDTQPGLSVAEKKHVQALKLFSTG